MEKKTKPVTPQGLKQIGKNISNSLNKVKCNS
uniref:Uncharacterized protein n=1 Tax=Siphoviridae sp. ctOCb13 TaxID=2825477 RepID=A0A8S5Q0P3_9CAUD|nr:MAG TPA: hypothetical protein [Siphoviridae sp. ctOCb13]